ncbi:PREDICTED: uncharacterized protein LOC104575481 [Tinamus guttatus]|uniref:uncharacterized protein LOC104575481 n=1 Tax=Tinamus guttatus TaxID=94827 RepID=UPI00052F1BDF|nr:PREDICTED: uncharacterized protein LOC104575481 [Tinamus guttatus]
MGLQEPGGGTWELRVLKVLPPRCRNSPPDAVVSQPCLLSEKAPEEQPCGLRAPHPKLLKVQVVQSGGARRVFPARRRFLRAAGGSWLTQGRGRLESPRFGEVSALEPRHGSRLSRACLRADTGPRALLSPPRAGLGRPHQDHIALALLPPRVPTGLPRVSHAPHAPAKHGRDACGAQAVLTPPLAAFSSHKPRAGRTGRFGGHCPSQPLRPRRPSPGWALLCERGCRVNPSLGWCVGSAPAPGAARGSSDRFVDLGGGDTSCPGPNCRMGSDRQMPRIKQEPLVPRQGMELSGMSRGLLVGGAMLPGARPAAPRAGCGALPRGRVTAFVGHNIVVAQIIWEGLWMNCVVQSTGQMQCRVYESMLALPQDLQAARALVVIAIVLAVLGTLLAITGGKCTNCVEDDTAKARVMIVSGIIFVIAGIMILIPISWSANSIIRDFYDPLVTESQKRELGSSLYVGWAASALLLIGGLILCCSCPRHGEKPYSAKYTASRSVPGKDREGSEEGEVTETETRHRERRRNLSQLPQGVSDTYVGTADAPVHNTLSMAALCSGAGRSLLSQGQAGPASCRAPGCGSMWRQAPRGDEQRVRHGEQLCFASRMASCAVPGGKEELVSLKVLSTKSQYQGKP